MQKSSMKTCKSHQRLQNVIPKIRKSQNKSFEKVETKLPKKIKTNRSKKAKRVV